MNATLLHGDCLEQLRTLPDNSVDAVVTDPPYGLAFMGKRWDYDVPSVEIWQECLRVLKPGGHLLAFAGTRTQHRMAVRIEDAGFEIRDMIAWVYSSGFPKSHNFGCKCRGSTLPYPHEEVPREQTAKRSVRSVCNPDVSSALDTCQGRGEVLQPSVSEQGAPATGWEEPSAAQARGGQSRMEGRGDVLAQAWQLQADQVREVPAGLLANGKEGRIHHGASPYHGSNDREMFDADGGGSPQESQPAGQQTREPRVVPRQRNAQANRVGACEVCGGLTEWQGWGTALKPALEPITVARKPLCGTVAENVQQHGTGALNVDGCRVGTEPSPTFPRRRNARIFGTGGGQQDVPEQLQGRWPANLIHDGSEEVVGLFPDSARFFYCAKASKADRDEGCQALEKKNNMRVNGPRESEAEKHATKLSNHHPTVKPTDLMRYLCRLVTPPGGVVLDPFMGSGSTGKAAILEGFRFIGCEREAEYVEIARARIAAAEAERSQELPLGD